MIRNKQIKQKQTETNKQIEMIENSFDFGEFDRFELNFYYFN